MISLLLLSLRANRFSFTISVSFSWKLVCVSYTLLSFDNVFIKIKFILYDQYLHYIEHTVLNSLTISSERRS